MFWRRKLRNDLVLPSIRHLKQPLEPEMRKLIEHHLHTESNSTNMSVRGDADYQKQLTSSIEDSKARSQEQKQYNLDLEIENQHTKSHQCMLEDDCTTASDTDYIVPLPREVQNLYAAKVWNQIPEIPVPMSIQWSFGKRSHLHGLSLFQLRLLVVYAGALADCSETVL